MSRLRRLSVGDFPGAPPWFGRLVSTLNQILTDIATDKEPASSVAVGRNAGTALCRYVDLAFHAPENIEDAFPLYLQHDLPVPPREVRVSHTTDLTNAANVNVSAVQPTWDPAADGKRVAIRHISGLISNHKYVLTFAVQA